MSPSLLSRHRLAEDRLSGPLVVEVFRNAVEACEVGVDVGAVAGTNRLQRQSQIFYAALAASA